MSQEILIIECNDFMRLYSYNVSMQCGEVCNFISGKELFCQKFLWYISFTLLIFLCYVFLLSEIDSCVSCHGWKARSQVILTTLKSFNADFLCVQVQWCNASADFPFPGRNYHVFSPHLYLLRLIINIRGALWIMWLVFQ